jgi:hypothetical protein
MSEPTLSYRAATPRDHELVRKTLYLALAIAITHEIAGRASAPAS